MNRLYGTTTATGPGSPLIAVDERLPDRGGNLRHASAPGRRTWTPACSSSTWSSEWTWNGLAFSPLPTSPTIATTGDESSSASPRPVSELVTPGPGTTQSTPGRPVLRA